MNGRTNVIFGSTDSLGGIIPLEPPSNFAVIADNAKCLINWTDPLDKYADELGNVTDEGDQLVSQFALTRIVRKVGSTPSSPTDGDLVTESSLRNQYQSNQYIDKGLTNNVEYFYAAFACNTDGVWSGSSDIQSATPKAYDPILGNNTWEQINEVANEGFAPSVWEVGDEIDITLSTTGETVTCVIAGFNHHNLADGTGTAALTFVTKNLLQWRDGNTYCFTNSAYRNGTNSLTEAQSYIESDAYNYCHTKCIDELPQSLTTYLQTITTQYSTIGSDRWGNPDPRISSYDDKIFLLAANEIDGSKSGSDGAISMYSQIEYYSTVSNRIKKLDNGSGAAHMWGLPSMDQNNNGQLVHYVSDSGIVTSSNYASYSYRDTGMSFAFCIGKTAA